MERGWMELGRSQFASVRRSGRRESAFENYSATEKKRSRERKKKSERERERDRPMTMSSLLLRILLAFSLLFVSSDSASDVDSKYYEDGGSGGEQDEDGSDEYSPRESQYRCACASII